MTTEVNTDQTGRAEVSEGNMGDKVNDGYDLGGDQTWGGETDEENDPIEECRQFVVDRLGDVIKSVTTLQNDVRRLDGLLKEVRGEMNSINIKSKEVNATIDQFTRTIEGHKTEVGVLRSDLKNEVQKNKILETNLDRLDGSLKEIREEMNTQRKEDSETLEQLTKNVEENTTELRSDLNNNEAENKRLDNLLTQKEGRIKILEDNLVEVQYYVDSDKIRSTNIDSKIEEIENINDNMKSKMRMQMSTMLCTFVETGLTGIGLGLPVLSVSGFDLGSETDVSTSGYNSGYNIKTSTPMQNVQNYHYVSTVDNQNVLSQNLENSHSNYAMTVENQNDPSQNIENKEKQIEEVENSKMQDNTEEKQIEEVENSKMQDNTEEKQIEKVENSKMQDNTAQTGRPDMSEEKMEESGNDGSYDEASIGLAIDLTGGSEHDSDGDRVNVNSTKSSVTEWKDVPEDLRKIILPYAKNESMANNDKLNAVQRAYVKYFVTQKFNRDKKTGSLRTMILEGCAHGLFNKNQRIGDAYLKDYLQGRIKYELKLRGKVSMSEMLRKKLKQHD